jgi:hypothetical protein
MPRIMLLVPVLLVLAACGGAVVPTGTATTATVAGGAASYTTLGQSTTPEGYYVLGKTDAPVLMTHYSDFL